MFGLQFRSCIYATKQLPSCMPRRKDGRNKTGNGGRRSQHRFESIVRARLPRLQSTQLMLMAQMRDNHRSVGKYFQCDLRCHSFARQSLFLYSHRVKYEHSALRGPLPKVLFVASNSCNVGLVEGIRR